jgi:hypothetical protein
MTFLKPSALISLTAPPFGNTAAATSAGASARADRRPRACMAAYETHEVLEDGMAIAVRGAGGISRVR